MFHLNRVVCVLSLSLAACGNQAAKEPEAPMPPPAEATAPTTPSVAAASDQTNTPSDTGATSNTGAGSTGTATTDTTPKATPLTDEQILKIVDLANTAEVDQAKIAQGKAKNARVRKFAQTMINHHGDAKQKGAKLTKKLAVTPADSTQSSQLTSDSSNAMSTLKNTAAADFDRAYIELQIQEHTKVLQTIDNELVPNAKNDELKALLTEIRPKVEAHLAEAKDIQQALANSAATPATTGAEGGAGAAPAGAGTGTGSGTTGSGTGSGTGAKPPAGGASKSGSPGNKPGGSTPGGGSSAPGGAAPGGGTTP